MDGSGRDLRSLRAVSPYAQTGFVYRSEPLSSRFFQFLSSVSTRFIERVLAGFARLPKGFGSSLTVALFVGTAVFGLYRGGHLDAFVATYGEPRSAVARLLGFDIRSVTISGLLTLDEKAVLAAAAIGPEESLPFLDADVVRARLLEVPMIREVAVRKFYPNALSIGIVENKPYAIWQMNGDLSVIGVDGRVIGPLDDEAFAQLPHVVGEGAASHIGEFVALLDSQADVKPLVRAGVRVGDRRWTLKLNNGFDVFLPEDAADKALARFAAMVRDKKILDRDIVSVDLRQSDRVTLRLTEAAANARVELLKARAKAKGGPA
jgi:cell division protein FtsQ